MRTRIVALSSAVVLLIAACAGDDGGTADDPLGGTTTTVGATDVDCAGKTLTSPEIGVTDKEITVTVIADVDNPARPAVFEGSWNGVKAWADFMNANGGLACRKVVVKTRDSHLSAEESKNAVAAACGDSLALVGTTAIFLQDVRAMDGCKDRAGAATGLPDIALLQTETRHQCSEVSFAVLPTGAICPYSGSGVRDYAIPRTQYDYYTETYPGEDLHGVFVIPKDLPSTIAVTMPIFRASNQVGMRPDAEFGLSALATQPEYTQVVQAMKTNRATYARNMIDYSANVLMRKEAKAQGIDTVKVWDCSVQCYDKRLITEGGDAVEGQYVWISFLPLEDGLGTNANLDAFIRYNKKPDGFGAQAFVAGMAFTEAVNKAIASHGNDPNAITRANLLTEFRNMHDFDAGGMIPKTDIGGKRSSVCVVGLQVQNGRLVRVSPVERGMFNCGKDLVELSIDPIKEYKG
jgi:ABC-type branched-subunit amino acid transport system substrate-binding protein